MNKIFLFHFFKYWFKFCGLTRIDNTYNWYDHITRGIKNNKFFIHPFFHNSILIKIMNYMKFQVQIEASLEACFKDLCAYKPVPNNNDATIIDKRENQKRILTALCSYSKHVSYARLCSFFGRQIPNALFIPAIQFQAPRIRFVLTVYPLPPNRFRTWAASPRPQNVEEKTNSSRPELSAIVFTSHFSLPYLPSPGKPNFSAIIQY